MVWFGESKEIPYIKKISLEGCGCFACLTLSPPLQKHAIPINPPPTHCLFSCPIDTTCRDNLKELLTDTLEYEDGDKFKFRQCPQLDHDHDHYNDHTIQ